MAHVTVTIDGRQYRMACEDGQEDHLTQLADAFNQRVEQLRGSFGQIGDHRLLVMAALMVSDELAEALNKVQQLEQDLTGAQETRVAAAGRSQLTQAAVVAALNAAAERIERVAKGLNQSLGDGVGIG
jgi:cell division protein ZapA